MPEGAAFRFLQMSTDEVYGTVGEDSKFSETTPYALNSPYSASKAASDHLVHAFHHTYGLPVLTTNCSNNHDPYHFPEKLIPLVLAEALAGEPLSVYGDGKQVRDWLFLVTTARRSAPCWAGTGRRYGMAHADETRDRTAACGVN